MSDRPFPVEITDVEDLIVPDNSFEEAYAIYFHLSHEPPLEWEDAFQRLMEREIRQRIVSFVGAKMRVVITRRDNLDMVMRQMASLTRRVNVQLDYSGES